MHTQSTCPDTITRTQYVAALKAFGEAVGLDPQNTLMGLHLDGDRINCQVIVPADDGNKWLSLNRNGVGNQTSILAATVRIDVVPG